MEDTASLSPPDEIAEEIVEDLRAALEQLEGDSGGLGRGAGCGVKCGRNFVDTGGSRRYMFKRIWARLRRRWTRHWRYLGDNFRSSGFRWVALVLSTLAVCGYLTLNYWPYLHDGKDSLSATVRNVSLIIGGIIAVELALWRSIVGERQTAVAQRQAETAQRDLLNQQLQKGAEMLGSSTLSVRLGGIYALKHLAVEHPEQYHVQVMEQLCAFVRGATGADGQATAIIEETLVTREELQVHAPRS